MPINKLILLQRKFWQLNFLFWRALEKLTLKTNLCFGLTTGFSLSSHCSLKIVWQSNIFDFNPFWGYLKYQSLHVAWTIFKKWKNLCTSKIGQISRFLSTSIPHGSVAVSRIDKTSFEICSRSDKIPESVLVPRIFLNVVCASIRVDECTSFIFCTDAFWDLSIELGRFLRSWIVYRWNQGSVDDDRSDKTFHWHHGLCSKSLHRQ